MRRVAGVVSVLLLATLLSGCGRSWQSSLVSVNAAGTDSGNGASGRVGNPVHRTDYVFSPDGTKIAFISQASDLSVPAGNPGYSNLYVRNLAEGTTTLASISAAGTGGSYGSAYDPVFSPDGTKLAFTSTANDLGPADAGSGEDVYLRDLVTGTTSLVSAGASGNAGGGSDAVFSPDGTKIAFFSKGGFDPADTDRCLDFGSINPRGCVDVYVRDLAGGTTTLVSADAAGASTGTFDMAGGPVFSPVDDSVAFVTAEPLVPTDTNQANDVYIGDLSTGTTLFSTNGAGTSAGNGGSSQPVFSPDGSRIAFTSTAGDLGTIDTDAQWDVFVRDIATGATTLVTPNAAGTASADGDSWYAYFSPDGAKVAFTSNATDLVAPEPSHDTACPPDFANLYVRDLAAAMTTFVAHNGNVGTSCVGRLKPAYSAVSDAIAFETPQPLVPEDTNGGLDVYVYDVPSAGYSLLAVTPDGEATTGSTTAVWDPNGDRIAYLMGSGDVGPTDTNGTWDVYLASPRN